MVLSTRCKSVYRFGCFLLNKAGILRGNHVLMRHSTLSKQNKTTFITPNTLSNQIRGRRFSSSVTVLTGNRKMSEQEQQSKHDRPGEEQCDQAADIKRCRVELHVHLEGSLRYETVVDLARIRKIKLPDGVSNADELKKYLLGFHGSLTEFLKPFPVFIPTISGSKKAIKRIVREFCEDAAKDGIIYVEVRYCPYYLQDDGTYQPHQLVDKEDSRVDNVRDVVHLVNEGLKEGEKEFNIKARSILSCIKAHPAWSRQILDLCEEFKHEGVVGIDIAGDEKADMDEEHIRVFQDAAKAAIHRTVHAGESGSYKNVEEAVDKLKAERIGHGYHVLENEATYELMRTKNIHFETCPLSSYCTGAVQREEKHPIIRFAKDKVNFSINSDDPIMTGQPLSGDYRCVIQELHLTEDQVLETIYNAARSSFLTEKEKKSLIKDIEDRIKPDIKVGKKVLETQEIKEDKKESLLKNKSRGPKRNKKYTFKEDEEVSPTKKSRTKPTLPKMVPENGRQTRSMTRKKDL